MLSSGTNKTSYRISQQIANNSHWIKTKKCLRHVGTTIINRIEDKEINYLMKLEINFDSHQSFYALNINLCQANDNI